MANIKEFQKVYPFTTENIAGYITQIDICDKKVLTVGSSCDQAINSLLLGAKEVTVFDINEKIAEFYEIKRKLILESKREELVRKVLECDQIDYSDDVFGSKQLEKMNLYLQNDENYEKIRQILMNRTIKFVTGNIFDVNSSLDNNSIYDRVILSNVLQYLPKATSEPEQLVYKVYKDICNYLSEDAIIQLYYLYGSMYPKHFAKIVNEFTKYDTLLNLKRCDEQDSFIYVKKGQTINKK